MIHILKIYYISAYLLKKIVCDILSRKFLMTFIDNSNFLYQEMIHILHKSIL